MSQRGSINDPQIQANPALPNTKVGICQEQLDLLTAWANATRASSNPANKYNDLADHDAELRCAIARKQFEDHIEQHGCRKKSS